MVVEKEKNNLDEHAEDYAMNLDFSSCSSGGGGGFFGDTVRFSNCFKAKVLAHHESPVVWN